MRHERAVTPTHSIPPVCGFPGAHLVLNYTLAEKTGFSFDLCSAINCGPNEASWRGYDMYSLHLRCNEGKAYLIEVWCPTWGTVTAYTVPHSSPTYSGTNTWTTTEWWKNVSLIRQQGGQSTEGANPLLLTMHWDQNIQTGKINQALYLVLGVETPGRDPKTLIQINLANPTPPKANISTPPIIADT